jgi:hypothetical protein
MNAMLEPRIVVARIQGPLPARVCPEEDARITPSSQGGLAIVAMAISVPRTCSCRTSSRFCQGYGILREITGDSEEFSDW